MRSRLSGVRWIGLLLLLTALFYWKLAFSNRFTSPITSGPRSLRIALPPSGSGKDVFDGGPGVDTVSYNDHTAAVTATINGKAAARKFDLSQFAMPT